MHVSAREEANAYECERRSMCASAREEACTLLCESLI
jgi:hypothetical protein